MTQNKRPTISDLFPNWIDGQAIFTRLNEMYDLPWKNDFDSLDIDIDYLGKYGTRLVSNLALQLINKYKVFDKYGRPIVDDNNEPLVTDDNLTMLCKIIWRRFGKNWQKLYDTLSFEYNPIENYSMNENENVKFTKDLTRKDVASGTNSSTETGTDSQTGKETTNGTETEQRTESGTNSHTSSKTNTGTVGVQNDGTGSIYGFNSSAKSDVSATEGSSTTTNNLTESITESGTDSKTTNATNGSQLVVDSTNSKTINNEVESESTNNVDTTEQDEQETTRSHSRSGNIGVTTSQQMIQAERELWLFDYFDTVYKQVNTIMTIPYYE